MKKGLSLAVIVCMVCSLLVSFTMTVSAAGTTLTFDDWTASDVRRNISVGGSQSINNVKLDNTQYRGESGQSLWVGGRKNTYDRIKIRELFPNIAVGSQYKVTAYVKIADSATPDSGNILVATIDDGTTPVGGTSVEANKTDWTKVEFTYEVTDKAYAMLAVQQENNNPLIEAYYVDDITIELLDGAPAAGLEIVATQSGYQAVGTITDYRSAQNEPQQCKVILAMYEGSALKNVVSSDYVEFDNDSTFPMNVDAQMDVSLEDGQYLRAFLWNGALASLAEPIKYDPTEFTLHLVGDSIVTDYAENSERQGWGTYIGDLLSDKITVNNTAVSGYSTKSYMDTGLWERTVEDIRPGDYVMVSLGINDTASDDSKRTDEAQYRANLQKFADDTKAAGATIIFITPTITISQNPIVQGFSDRAKWMKEIAAANDAVSLDLNATMYEEFSKIPYDELRTKYFNSADTTHFNKAGAQHVAQMIIDLLAQSDSELKAYIQ